MVHNVNKDVKTREKDLLKTAKAASKRLNKGEGGSDIASLLSKDNAINSDEKELRDKLVSKLKQKEIDKMEQCGENLRQSCLYSDDSMEDISEEDLDVIIRHIFYFFPFLFFPLKRCRKVSQSSNTF